MKLQNGSVRQEAFRKILPLMLLAVRAVLPAQSLPAQDPPRLKRADSFLGIHFDFHAGADCTEIGKNTTPAMVENIIDLVHPDYLQIDCKGHPGLSSYPTKVGHPAPGFVGDPLRVWREVTARRGVSLYMHYSGVWDSKAVAGASGLGRGQRRRQHQQQGHVVLWPLRREAADPATARTGRRLRRGRRLGGRRVLGLGAGLRRGGAEGVPRGDRHPGRASQAERPALVRVPPVPSTGLSQLPAPLHRGGEEDTPDVSDLQQLGLHRPHARAVCAPVDFLSGDYSPQDSVNSARLSARFLARQGKPWDLMAWSFSTQPDRRQKTAVQLQREAAVVLALGGGFQAYFKQKRDGSIYDEQMPVMAEVAKFCRARQAVCHHAEAVPQVALLFSTAAHYRKNQRAVLARQRPTRRCAAGVAGKPAVGRGPGRTPSRRSDGGVPADRGARMGVPGTAIQE